LREGGRRMNRCIDRKAGGGREWARERMKREGGRWREGEREGGRENKREGEVEIE